MMLRRFSLHLDALYFPDRDFGRLEPDFRYQARSICNYLARCTKEAKVRTEGFHQIGVVGTPEPREKAYLISTNVLVSEIPFPLDTYRALDLTPRALNEFFIKLINLGLEKCERNFEIPRALYHSAIEDFRASGYVNDWQFKPRRLFREHNLKCSLIARLGIDAFHLTMIIARGREEVFHEEIMTTKPDEIHFMREIEDIRLINGRIVLIDPIWEKEVWSIGVDDLSQ